MRNVPCGSFKGILGIGNVPYVSFKGILGIGMVPYVSFEGVTSMGNVTLFLLSFIFYLLHIYHYNQSIK